MKTNRGKGYFYSMGARDGSNGIDKLTQYRPWPTWAIESYEQGYLDNHAYKI